MHHGSPLGSLLFLLYTSERFYILENKLIGYDDDSTLMAVVPSPGVRVTVAEFLIRDLCRVSEWCDLRAKKLNASKTRTMIVCKSSTMYPQSPPLTSGRTMMKKSDDLVMLLVIFDSKMTFEKHLRSFPEQLLKNFASPGSPGQYSKIDRFLGDAFRGLSCPFGVLFCRVVLSCRYTPLTTGPRSQWCPFSNWGVFECDTAHRRSVAVLCMLYKIKCNPMHHLNGALLGPYVPVWVTRCDLVAQGYTYTPPRGRTSQNSRTFIPLSVSLWNDFADSVFDCVGLAGFKSRVNGFFIGLSCSIPSVVLYYFSPSLLSVYKLVLLDWDLRSDGVYITVSQPCTADLS